FMKDVWQLERLNRWHVSLELAQDDREMTLLSENVYSETRLAFERVTAIARSAGKIIVNQAPVPLHQCESDLLRLIRSQALDRRIDEDWFEFSPIFNLKRVANGKVQVGDARVSLEHRGQNLVEIRKSHGSPTPQSSPQAVL